MRNRTRAAAIALLLLGTSTVALAHAHLRRADPPAGGIVQSSPPQIELTFSEVVEPRFSTIMVTDEAGQQVDQKDVHSAPGNARRLAVSLSLLHPGVYKVAWRAISVDTHKTEDAFSFTVAP